MLSDKNLVGDTIELTATYKPTGASESVTLTVKESLTDFSKVQVRWMSEDLSGVVAQLETSTVFNYNLNFVDYSGDAV